VIDASGQPVAGAVVERYSMAEDPLHVEAKSSRVEQVTTDNRGRVEFTLTNQAPMSLLVKKAGLATAWTQYYPAAQEDELATGEVSLTPPTVVAGKVRDTAGKPVTDAEVYVKMAFRQGKREMYGWSWATLNPELARQLYSARTGADGGFRIEGLPADASLDLGVTKPGLAIEGGNKSYNPVGMPFEAGRTNIELVMAKAGYLEGRVVREGTDTPLGGVRVTSFPGNNDRPAITGEDGVFRLNDLGEGQHTLRAFAGTNQFSDWVFENMRVEVRAGATNRDVKIIATRGGVLEVTVTTEGDNRPIAEANVSASRDNLGAGGRTSADGVARFRLSPGSYSVYAQKPGWGNDQSQAAIEDGQTNRVSVTLKESPKITGIVVGPDGKPAAGVNVLVFSQHAPPKQTDGEGRFKIVVDANRYGGQAGMPRVLIARDLVNGLAALVEIEEDATNATLKLEPGLAIAGRAIDANGKAVTNAEAQVMLLTERMGTTIGEPVSGDAGGRFEIRGLPRNQRYGVNLSAKGYGRANRNLETEETGKASVELDPLTLPTADLRISGVVVDNEDKPVSGAHVNGYGDSQAQVNGQTDSKGRFDLGPVCAGPIQLSANAPTGGSYGGAQAEGGDTNITLRLGTVQNFSSRAGTKYKGVVTDSEGKPAPKVSVHLYPNYSGPSENKTDAEGRFTLVEGERYGNPAGGHVIIARDIERNLAAAVDPEEGTTNVSLKLEPGLVLTGQVTDMDGKAIAGAQVQPMIWTERMGSWMGAPVKADAGGKFEVKALAPDRSYGVNISAKGYGQDSRRIDPPEGGTRRLELDPFQLLVADQRIAGVVVDVDDKPVRGAWIHSYGEKQPQLSGQTDAKGRFSFDKVCAGAIQLSANSQRGDYGNVTAAGGETNIVLRISRSSGYRSRDTRAVSLKGRPLPDLAALGVSASDLPADKAVLLVFIDAEQRPSRRAVRQLAEQADALKQKGLGVAVVHSGEMAEEALAEWKQESGVPFPVGSLKGDSAKARTVWGTGAMPWIILADKSRKVVAEGVALEELDSQLQKLER
jgi:protocatechuate 3,4-dioxygenase beta subunit